MARRRVGSTATLLSILILASGCGAARPHPTTSDFPVTYEYFVEVSTEQPYSGIFDARGLRYLVQFPGHNPFDSFLYGDDLVAFLFLDAGEASYSIRGLWLGLSHNGREIAFRRASFLDKEANVKQRTIILKQTDPPRDLALDQRGAVLIGFSFDPSMVQDLGMTALTVQFGVEIEEVRATVRRQFFLKKVSRTEIYQTHPKYVERERGHAVLVGPWWLDWSDWEKSNESLSKEYLKVSRAALSDSHAASRLTGAGFLPRLRFDSIHFEGFFLHVDDASSD